ELLYKELENQNPEHLVELHLRAVTLLQYTQPEEAIAHALTAQAFTSAAHLIETILESLLAQGRLSVLAQWIDTLPTTITRDHPRLLLARANIFLEGSVLTTVQQLLQQALSNLTTSNQ